MKEHGNDGRQGNGGGPPRSPFADRESFSGYVIVALKLDFVPGEGDTLHELAAARGLKGLQSVLHDFGDPPTERAITSVAPERLLEIERRITAAGRPPRYSMAAYWRIDMRDQPERMPALVQSLEALDEVQNAYVDLAVSTPGINPSDDPWAFKQTYLDPAPDGIDAKYAWKQAHGDGAGVQVFDLEQAWGADVAAGGGTTIAVHEDLQGKLDPALVYGVNRGGSPGDRNHGAAVLGIIAGVDNAKGIIGIAPNLPAIRLASHWNGTEPGHVADAIAAVVSALTATGLANGEILVLEVQTGRGNITGWPDYYPIEAKDLECLAIQAATASNIIVIEAAGNGGSDLDAYVAPQGMFAGTRPLNRNIAAEFQDTRAVVVGGSVKAATSFGMPAIQGHRRWSNPGMVGRSSNYGSRIDCYAWAEQVTTSGFGDIVSPSPASETQWYTPGFWGTSAATPIIAGAAALLQGMAKATTGAPLSVAQMTAALTDPTTSTPRDPAVAGDIGVMPDLARIIPKLGFVPDVYLRDAVGDTGAQPWGGALSSSPDIIVRPAQEPNPQAAWGEGSGNENRDDLGADALAGQNNFLYLRLRNRGGNDALQVKGKIWWSEPATLVTPGLWHWIGETPPVDVPKGDALTVTGPLAWAQGVPPPGHYCFIALVGCEQDPAPPVPAATDWNGFLDLIRGRNNGSWRNFNVVAPAQRRMAFLIAGAPDRERAFDFEIIQRLSNRVRVDLEVPIALAPGLVADRLWPARHDARRTRTAISLPAQPSVWFRQIQLPREARLRSSFFVRAPANAALDGASIAIRQLYEGREVGRITWRFSRRLEPEAAA